jgi:sugar lactone lactonase YvrE
MRKALLAFFFAVTASAHPGSGIVVDRDGTVYFVDTGSGIYRIDRGGKATRVAGPAFHWMALDGKGRFAQTRWPSIRNADFSRADGNPALLMSSDYPVTIGRDGALIFVKDGRLMKVTPDGTMSAGAVLPGAVRWVNGLTTRPDGSLYYTENTAVRRIRPNGSIETVASNVTVRPCARIPGSDGGAYLRGIHVTANGTIYVTASGCGATLEISPTGVVRTIFRTQAPWSPTAVTASGNTLYVLEYLHTVSEPEDRREWIPRVRRIEPGGATSIIATVKR